MKESDEEGWRGPACGWVVRSRSGLDKGGTDERNGWYKQVIMAIHDGI